MLVSTDQQQQRRAAARRYRQRQRDGDMILRVPVNAHTLQWLVQKARWITEEAANAGDRTRLGQLVGEGLKLSAKKWLESVARWSPPNGTPCQSRRPRLQIPTGQ